MKIAMEEYRMKYFFFTSVNYYVYSFMWMILAALVQQSQRAKLVSISFTWREFLAGLMACGDEVRGQRAKTPVPTPDLSSPCRTSPRMAVSPLQKSPCQRPCHPHWKRPRTPDFEKTGGLSQSTSGRYVLCTSRGLVWVFGFVKSWSMSSHGFTPQLSFSKATPCFMYHQVFDTNIFWRWILKTLGGDSMALVITSSTVK